MNPPGAFTEELGRGLLASVSRSFYLSLRVLPRPVRGPLSLAYLLARASDTIADSSSAPVAERESLLLGFHDCLENPGAPPLPVSGLAVEHPGESCLLDQLPRCFAWFHATRPAVQSLIREVLAPIIQGQREDLTRTRITSAAELDHYTWQVAGCVGEFWTRLCFQLLPHFSDRSEEEMIALGSRFGRGLQLINILRDVPKDLALGRIYLPLDGPATPDTLWTAAQPWIETCRAHLDCGQKYAESVHGLRSRFAIFLPLLLARETLALVTPAAMLAPVKVPRSRMKQLLLCALWQAATA